MKVWECSKYGTMNSPEGNHCCPECVFARSVGLGKDKDDTRTSGRDLDIIANIVLWVGITVSIILLVSGLIDNNMLLIAALPVVLLSLAVWGVLRMLGTVSGLVSEVKSKTGQE